MKYIKAKIQTSYNLDDNGELKNMLPDHGEIVYYCTKCCDEFESTNRLDRRVALEQAKAHSEVHENNYEEERNDRREFLMDLLTPNGKHWDELQELLEMERELTLEEGM